MTGLSCTGMWDNLQVFCHIITFHRLKLNNKPEKVYLLNAMERLGIYGIF